MTKSRLSWGILGSGGISHTFARGLAKSRTGKLVAIGSRNASGAGAFAEKFGPIRTHSSYDGLIADPAVEAVYISIPHPFHAEWCLKTASAKKHILCEKPLTMNHAEALAVAEAVRDNGVFLMEAFMYRCHPQTAKLVELIQQGAIGEVGNMQATFSFRSEFNPESRLFSNALGGGGILDIGCYTLSIARLIAGVAMGKGFADPVNLTGLAKLHPETGTDLFALATVKFPGDIFAQLACGVGLDQDGELRVFGNKGNIRIANPFVPAKEGGTSTIILAREGCSPETITVQTDDWLFGLEADAVADALADNKRESPYMSVADTLGNMAALDEWREAVGVVYDCEQTSAKKGTGPVNLQAGSYRRAV